MCRNPHPPTAKMNLENLEKRKRGWMMDGILGFVSYFFSVYGVSPYLVFLMVSSLKSVIVRSRYIGGRDLSSRL